MMKKIFTPFKKFFTWFKGASKKKKTLVIVLLLIVVIVIASALSSNDKNGYVFDTVQKHTITEIVSENGNVTTSGRTDVYSPSQGIVEEVYVQNGEIVGIDQPLFKVKSTATEDEKAAAYATYVAAQSTLKTSQQSKLALQAALEAARKSVLDAQAGVDTLDDNRDNGRVNPATGKEYTNEEIEIIESSLSTERLDFSTAEKKYVEADVAIGASAAALTQAKLAYESTKDRVVNSPTIGTVSNLSVSVGSGIKINTVTAPTNPALTIANFSSNEIILELNESDVSKVQVGQNVIVDPDVIDNATYNGVVKRVDDIGTDVDGVIVYKAYIDVTNADEKLKSGMTVDVDITTSELKDVLSVPNAAVKPYQGGRAVRVLNNETGELDFIPVVIGVKGEKYTQILEGVSEGQEIVVSLTNDKIDRAGPLGF